MILFSSAFQVKRRAVSPGSNFGCHSFACFLTSLLPTCLLTSLPPHLRPHLPPPHLLLLKDYFSGESADVDYV